MKITKIAQFENEGHNIEETPEAQTFQNQQDMENQTLGKSGPTFTAQLLHELTKNQEVINSAYVADGSVSWVKFNDKYYEITVSPAYIGKHINFFKSLQQ